MELLTIMRQVIENVIDRISGILSTPLGWVWSGIVFLFTWLITWMGDTREMLMYLVLAAVILDLIWGIASSAKRGAFVLSTGLAKTGIKLAVYISLMSISALVEKSLDFENCFIFRLSASVLIVAEGVSICGHILIIKPDTPVIRLLWTVLKSEIAKKLGIEVKEIDSYINQQKNEETK